MENLKTYSQLRKEAKKAPKFILTAWNEETQSYIFVADRYKTGEHELTENIQNALNFDYGFDDEVIKEKSWSISTGFEFIAIKAEAI